MTGWNLPPGVTGGESYFYPDERDELLDDMPSEAQLQNWNEANDYTHEGEEDDEPLYMSDEQVAALGGVELDEPELTPYRNCPTCGGQGSYVQLRPDMSREAKMCPTCGGTGRVAPVGSGDEPLTDEEHELVDEEYRKGVEELRAMRDADPGPVPETEYPDGLPATYAVFQIAGDERWYAGWLELLSNGSPWLFHVLTVPHKINVQSYATQEEARRACWRDDWSYLE